MADGACSLRHPQRPCSECPWRRDQPVGRFPADRYRVLADTSRHYDGFDGVRAPVFACHKSREELDLACAGWLAVVGADHIGMRLAVATGRLAGDALRPGPGWPALYRSYVELATANGVSATDPSLQGVRDVG